MRHTRTNSPPVTSMKLCMLIISTLAVVHAQDTQDVQDAQDQLTSTFLSLPPLSLAPMPILPSLPLTAPDVSSSPPASSTTDQPFIDSNLQPPPVKTLAASLPAPPNPMATWEVLPAGVPRTKSGNPIKCSPKNTKLNPSTHKFISDCVENMFCAAPPGAPVNATGLGVCFPRVCRRDEFPFGYVIPDIQPSKRAKAKANTTAADPLPAMCAGGMFCPDDGSGCRQQLAIGSSCELERDEQCQSPPSNPSISDADNKSICLNRKCMAATLPLGAPCIIENTTYVGDIDRGRPGGGQFMTTVIKHNCLSPGLFCDPTPPNVNNLGPICQPTKKLGESCRFDTECELRNCESSKCVVPAETPRQIEPWHWVATILFVVASIITAFLILLLLHKRRRFRHHQRLQAYYYEQISLRRSILALHAAATEQQALNKVAAEKSV